MIYVASYCRVSTDKDDQANSFEAQQRYFKEYIDRQPDWELYEVYADEGITGTSTKKRAAFNRMINDAHMGRFKLIITKEVSRFSRNILDTISYTRELRQIGVGVLFMNDGISTLEPDAELRLSIMGSIAQEESRKTSSRVKWGQMRQMERGIVFGRSLLGYDVRDGHMTVEPEGAALVRLIFHKYGIEKKGTSVIARELREAGFLTYRGNPKWSGSHILKILRNEKYVGDLVQKKTFTPDYLTHTKKPNHGEEELVVLENHHEPIIDRDLWNLVQSEITRRNRHGTLGAGHSSRYLFSGRIKCGECGASFVARKRKRKDGSFYKYWCCYTAANEGERHLDLQGKLAGCSIGKTVRDEQATAVLKQCIHSLQVDTGWIARRVSDITLEAIHAGESGTIGNTDRLEFEIGQLMKKKEDVLEAFFSKSITKEEMRMMNERYDSQLDSLRGQLDAMKARARVSYETATLQTDIRKHMAAMVAGDCGDEVFLKNSLDHMVVFRERRMEVRLNLLPPKWRFVLESLRDIRRQIAAENGANFQNAEKTAETPVVSTVSEVRSHFDPSVLAGFPGEASEKSQYLQGFPGRSHFDASVPMSVSTACKAG